MRLKQNIKEQIVKYSKKHFGDNVRLYLFGSRIKDDKKGGDIDLFLDAKYEVCIQDQIYFLRDIYKYVTQRKVDLLIKTPQKKAIAIVDTAIKEGILLC